MDADMCISIWPRCMTCPVSRLLCAQASRKTRNMPHFRVAGTDFNGQTATRDTSLSTLKPALQRGAKLGPWRKPNHDHRPPRAPSSRACDTSHSPLRAQSRHWRGWSKDKRGRLEARGGAQMAHADRQRSRRSCVLIAGVCTRCLVRCSPYPFGAQCLPNGYECERRAIHGLLHMQERV